MSLADNQCIPCRGGVPPVAADRAQALLKELGRGWAFNAAGHLERVIMSHDSIICWLGRPVPYANSFEQMLEMLPEKESQRA